MDSLNFYNEILDEIKAEERAEEERRKRIIKNGCPHAEKIKRKSLVYKTEWLECSVCGKQFYLDGITMISESLSLVHTIQSIWILANTH